MKTKLILALGTLAIGYLCVAGIVSPGPIMRPITSVGGGGGIAFEAAYSVLGTSGADPLVLTNVTAPADSIILVFYGGLGNLDVASSLTFNTTENFTVITNLVDKSGGVGAYNSAWILHNPTATTASITLDFLVGVPGGFPTIHALVYTGVKNDAGASGAYRALNSTGDSGGSGVDVSVAATSGDWIVGSLANWDNAPAGTLASTSHTARKTDNAVGGSAYDLATQDSNGTVSGTTSLTWSGDEFCTAIGLALIPQ